MNKATALVYSETQKQNKTRLSEDFRAPRHSGKRFSQNELHLSLGASSLGLRIDPIHDQPSALAFIHRYFSLHTLI